MVHVRAKSAYNAIFGIFINCFIWIEAASFASAPGDHSPRYSTVTVFFNFTFLRMETGIKLEFMEVELTKVNILLRLSLLRFPNFVKFMPRLSMINTKIRWLNLVQLYLKASWMLVRCLLFWEAASVRTGHRFVVRQYDSRLNASVYVKMVLLYAFCVWLLGRFSIIRLLTIDLRR